ncbi:hypothetical protein SAMN03159463_01742 [Mesorhizobium sp. NFR06]|nr:hypothetical protein SAMN03159463_01742 [Mesorhizobium sp. NFR06]
MLVRRHEAGSFAEVLAWWVAAIGIGSTVFHTFATKGTIWADILPIAGFTLAHTLFNLRRFLGMEWGKAMLVFVVFYAIAGLITFAVPDWLHQARRTARPITCRRSWRSPSSGCGWRPAATGPAGTI